VSFVLVLLVLGGVIGLAHLGGAHFPRCFVACLSLGLGWIVGVSWAWRLPVGARLAYIAVGVAGALAARWFVATTDGVSLWDANRTAARLEALSAEDIAGFAAGAGRRQAARRQFPEYAGEIADAENAWMQRCVRSALTGARRLRDDDPAAAARLRNCDAALARLPQAGWARQELLDTRRRIVLARCRRVEAEMKVLLGRGEFSVASETGRRAAKELLADAQATEVRKEVEDRILDQRRKAVGGCLKAVRTEVQAELAKGHFQAVARLGAALDKSLGAEAKALGIGEVGEFCATCQLLCGWANADGK
jgi:hypothetical protein